MPILLGRSVPVLILMAPVFCAEKWTALLSSTTCRLSSRDSKKREKPNWHLTDILLHLNGRILVALPEMTSSLRLHLQLITTHIWSVPENQGRVDRVIDQSLLSLRGHQKEIFNVRYSKATSTLASCGAETTIKLWSLNSDYHSNLSRSWSTFDLKETSDLTRNFVLELWIVSIILWNEWLTLFLCFWISNKCWPRNKLKSAFY